MFEHKKQLLHEVKVERPNPQYAVLMQEQLGGGNGELKAALQYLSQSFRVKDPAIKDLFLDIGTVDLSTPGPAQNAPDPTPPTFENPRK